MFKSRLRAQGKEIPYNDYFEYFAPNYELHLTPSSHMENENSAEYLDKIRTEVTPMNNSTTFMFRSLLLPMTCMIVHDQIFPT